MVKRRAAMCEESKRFRVAPGGRKRDEVEVKSAEEKRRALVEIMKGGLITEN